jgi:hypothetical protein
LEAVRKEKIEITLNMSEDEAEWLKNIMQNPLYDCDISTEGHQDRINREKLFASLATIIKH